MSPRDLASLRDMIDAARNALATAARTDLQALSGDIDLRQSLLYSLIVLGEAARRLSPELTSAHPHIPWRDIRDTRNRVAHGYDDIDHDLVWSIATVELPTLLPALIAITPPNDLHG